MCWNFFRNGDGEIKEMMKGMNSTMIYYKNFGKYHNVPQYNNNLKKKKENNNKCWWVFGEERSAHTLLLRM
jgi:hypothetical protein